LVPKGKASHGNRLGIAVGLRCGCVDCPTAKNSSGGQAVWRSSNSEASGSASSSSTRAGDTPIASHSTKELTNVRQREFWDTAGVARSDTLDAQTVRCLLWRKEAICSPVMATGPDCPARTPGSRDAQVSLRRPPGHQLFRDLSRHALPVGEKEACGRTDPPGTSLRAGADD
jgi:hypothetical protein